MKITLRNFLLFSLLLLVACQVLPEGRPAPTSPPTARAAQPTPIETFTASRPAATAGPIPTPPEPPPPTPTADPAVQAVQEYAAALQAGDFKAAAELLSNFSLLAAGMTRSEAGDELQARMAREQWSRFQVRGSRPFDARTTLVQVSYTVETTDPKSGASAQAEVDELWPVRFETGKWRYNRANLIDFRTLDVPAQTTAGLTVKPRQLTRYTDRIRLTLLVQNRTNEPIVLGQPNEIMAVFLFGEEKVEAEKTRLIFDRLRSYPDVVIEVKGLYDKYPDGVVIRQWKNVNVSPWFTFHFTQ